MIVYLLVTVNLVILLFLNTIIKIKEGENARFYFGF